MEGDTIFRNLPDLNPEEIASQVLESLQKAGIKKCFIVSYSMGGLVMREMVLNPNFNLDVSGCVILSSPLRGSGMRK